ncbi:Gfo/Idh/MocA family protein [Adhaeribacter rhizoryzae]|uniref:Gfo/Idh/MocA family oxidoreductase n=1 Tax=Adhaeribacter rhizoryzae TaxID=2607907 RepID=A0A5M6D5N1_9BACT|nr:Gfo/Idh/MocA family oxidoreductase [Adhaeribacter rhizoryzae]KAA5542818.1 Gfo/Idh/MocA family oxidoreductase [Adhaeribacter rhizoryzae]
MENKKLGWAIVGLGKFATEQLIPAFKDCKYSELVALVSGSPDKAKRIAAEYNLDASNIYDYQNYDSIKDNPAVDVIYIVLPNSLHAEFTVRGAQAGKHIMCEKPMATSVEDCQKMIEACRQAGKKLMIGYRAQYETYNLKCIELIREGKIGDLKLITSDHGRPLKPDQPEDKWRTNKKLAGGGSLMDIGIYSLQACRYLTGEEPVEISAMMSNTPNDPRFNEVEENITFSLRFPGGVLANCSSSYSFFEIKRFQAFGSEGNITLDPATDYNEHQLTLKTDAGTEEIKLEGNNHFAAEIDHFSECILENKTPKTPGEEGLQDVKLMMAIYEAAATGKPVKV